MSKIKNLILPDAFEFIRDRIAEILKDELNSQVVDYYNGYADAEVFVERIVAFDKTELPAINISIGTGDYSNQHQGQSQGDYIFFIDVHANSEYTEEGRGDELSSLQCSRLTSIVRSILENPIYKTLGFKPPYISRKYMQKFEAGVSEIKNKNSDALSTSMMRNYFFVSVPETTTLIEPVLIAGYDTKAKVNNTSRGYHYSGNTYN